MRGRGGDTLLLATAGLVLVALFAIVGIVYIGAVGRTVPDALPTLGAGAVGALATLMTGAREALFRRRGDAPGEQ